jgi:hypothetical protein
MGGKSIGINALEPDNIRASRHERSKVGKHHKRLIYAKLTLNSWQSFEKLCGNFGLESPLELHVSVGGIVVFVLLVQDSALSTNNKLIP